MSTCLLVEQLSTGILSIQGLSAMTETAASSWWTGHILLWFITNSTPLHKKGEAEMSPKT